MNIDKKKIIFILSLIIISTFSLVLILNNSNNLNQNNQEPLPNTENLQKQDEFAYATISAIGDIMIHTPQLKAQYDSKNDTYSFTNNFSKIKSILEKTDIALANLETTLSDGEYSGYPQFNSPDSLVDAIKYSGIDLLSLINNHSIDKGRIGLTRTLNIVRNKGIDTIGIKKDPTEKDYIIKDVSGIKIGFFAYSYGQINNDNKYLNGNPVPSDLKDLTNVFDPTDIDSTLSSMKEQIDAIKKEKVDTIVLFIHWGEEYQIQPNEFQKTLAQKLCDEGVDIIIGSHPHVIQPIEILKSSDKNSSRETLVIYSLGNAISNQREEYTNSKYTEDGVIPIITLEKNLSNNSTKIKNVEYIPTWVNKYYDNNAGKHVYEILPITKETYHSNKTISKKLEESYKNTTSIIGESDKIKALNYNNN